MKRIKTGTKITVQTKDLKVYTGKVKKDTGNSLTVEVGPKATLKFQNENVFTLSFS